MARRRRNKHIDNVESYRDDRFYLKLYLNKNLENILIDIKDDTIANRLLNDSKKSTILTRISWLNITKSNDYISYSTTENIKNPADGWSKENRKSIEIKKLIRKIYNNEFNNKLIKSFINKFRIAYFNFVNNYNSKKIYDKDVLENLIVHTQDNIIQWNKIVNNSHYEKYRTMLYITTNKYLLIELHITVIDDTDILSFYLINKRYDTKILIKQIKNNDYIYYIRDVIEHELIKNI